MILGGMLGFGAVCQTQTAVQLQKGGLMEGKNVLRLPK